MPAQYDQTFVHVDLEPELDARDMPNEPVWDTQLKYLLYQFPDHWMAVFHVQIPDPRWELRSPDRVAIAWFKTYNQLVCYRQDRRAFGTSPC